MITLKNDFISVKGENCSMYGGNQNHCIQKFMQGYACGVIGCVNVIMYDRHKVSGKLEISETDFLKLVEKLRKSFLPVIPKFGMNGLFMAFGLDLYYRVNHINNKAHWGCFPPNIFKTIEKMLSEDEPVVLSIGPNFPNFFGNNRLKLYSKINGSMVESTSTKAHYVTVTGIDDEWMMISSWGNRYYIRRDEYTYYRKHKSLSLFTNIMVVGKRK